MTRRIRAVAAASAFGLLATLALGGCAAQPTADPAPGAGDSRVVLRFTWWGNDKRTQITNEVIERFEAANPTIDIQAEPGDWGGYWDKLATQAAANDTPDVIQMDEKYISEYGKRNALLDLSGVDTSKFAPGTVELGEIDGKLYGINAGINAPIVVANPQVFADAGVEVPDDASWTWDDFHATAKAISDQGDGKTWGSMSLLSIDAVLKAWLRQNGKEQWTADGLGYEASDVASFWSWMKRLHDDGTFPSPAETTEDEGKPIDQSLVATNRVGMGFLWSNQITAMDKASGQDLLLLRPPSQDGSADQAGLWYKASMYWSASARTEHPEEAKKFIEYLATSPEAGAIMGTERGFPANTEVRAAIADKFTPSDTKVVAYLEQIQPELGTPSLVPPAGGGQSPAIQLRHAQNVLFGRGTPEAEAAAFHAEVTDAVR